MQADGAAESRDEVHRCTAVFWRWVAVAAPLRCRFTGHEVFAFSVLVPLQGLTEARGWFYLHYGCLVALYAVNQGACSN